MGPRGRAFPSGHVRTGTTTWVCSPPAHRPSRPREAIRRRPCPSRSTVDRAARRAEDAALLARIVERDERAVEDLYARYSGPLYSLAYQVTGADRFAQEVVQEVFVAALAPGRPVRPCSRIRRSVAVQPCPPQGHRPRSPGGQPSQARGWRGRPGAGGRARRRRPRGLAQPASRPRSRRPGPAERATADRARARLLRRPDPCRGRRASGHPAGHGQDAHPGGPAQAPRGAGHDPVRARGRERPTAGVGV